MAILGTCLIVVAVIGLLGMVASYIAIIIIGIKKLANKIINKE